MEPNIELSKTRDFGEVINDSFVFIRQNFKPLLSCFFTFCGFFLLAGAVAAILQQIKTIGMLSDTETLTRDIRENGVFAGLFRTWGIEFFLTMFFALLTATAMPVTILSFMALYKQKGNVAPTNEEVWGYFKYYFFKMLGCLFINTIILIVGFVFCVIPGVYLYPIMSLVCPIIIIENTSYGYAFNQSFRIIKENWWMVAGAIFITVLIVIIAATAVTIPVTLINLGTMFVHPTRGMHLSLTASIITVILQQLCHVLYILPLIAIALCYFSLTETKDATGLMSRIDQLGTNSDDTSAPAEEY